MAGNIETKYGTNNQAITISLASLGIGAAQQSTAVDNTTNVFDDALVSLAIKVTSGTGYINVYAYGTTDGGTNYTGVATGTNGAVTLTSPPNEIRIGTINTPGTSTYKGGPFSVASAFGGRLPDHWGIVVENQSGVALDATEGNHTKTYQGVYGQYT